MIFSRIRVRFCRSASSNASSCFDTAMKRLLNSEDCRNSIEVGERGGVGCKGPDLPVFPEEIEEAVLMDRFSVFGVEERLFERDEWNVCCLGEDAVLGGDQGPDSLGFVDGISGIVRNGVSCA